MSTMNPTRITHHSVENKNQNKIKKQAILSRASFFLFFHFFFQHVLRNASVYSNCVRFVPLPREDHLTASHWCMYKSPSSFHFFIPLKLIELDSHYNEKVSHAVENAEFTRTSSALVCWKQSGCCKGFFFF